MPDTAIQVVDFVLVWALLWAAISWLRRTPARVGLAGLATLVVFFLGARQIGLGLTTWVLQGFAAVAALTAVVVFQQDLRRLFEQIAGIWFSRSSSGLRHDVVDTLARTAAALAAQRRGALIVLPGRAPLDAHIEGGIALNGLVSEPLMLSLFDPHSAGHDGAVVVQGNRIRTFAAHLPLSTDHKQLGHRGTRHAAALGLSERTDALAIVVSEERGSISVAEAGALRTLRNPTELSKRIREFLARVDPSSAASGSRWGWAVREWRAGAAALPLTAALWVLSGPGSASVELTREVPVSVTGLPANYELVEVDPPSIEVMLSGSRRQIYLLQDDKVTVDVDALLAKLGRRTFEIDTENVTHPEGIRVLGVTPNQVKLSLRERKPPSAPATPAP